MLFIDMFHYESYFFRDKELGLKKDPSSSGPYIPQLPIEGSENELESYRALAQDMIVLINVMT